MSASQECIHHGRLQLQELILAARCYSTPSCFYRVNFLCSMGGHTHNGNMHGLLFCFLRAPWLHLGGRSSQPTWGALGYGPGFPSQPCFSCPLNREEGRPSCHRRPWAPSQCTQWVLEKGLKVSLIWIYILSWTLDLQQITTFGPSVQAEAWDAPPASSSSPNPGPCW